jgi:hypothetical protein
MPAIADPCPSAEAARVQQQRIDVSESHVIESYVIESHGAKIPVVGSAPGTAMG